MIAADVIGHLADLRWADRVAYAILCYGFVINLWAAHEPAVMKAYRHAFAYKAAVYLVAVIYFGLRITGLMQADTFKAALTWVNPLLLSAAVVAAQLTWWDRHRLREVHRQHEVIREKLAEHGVDDPDDSG